MARKETETSTSTLAEEKKYSKDALLKDEYLEEHYRVAKAVLDAGTKYSVPEAQKLVRDYLEGAIK